MMEGDSSRVLDREEVESFVISSRRMPQHNLDTGMLEIWTSISRYD